MTSINEAVATKLSNIAPVVSDKVVDVLVNKEVDRRVELITQGLSKLKELEKEAQKLSKPDVETFNADLTPIQPQFSKAKVEEIKKNKERMDKLTNALNKAIDSGDMGDLMNFLK